jgi:hypothetical protein
MNGRNRMGRTTGWGVGNAGHLSWGHRNRRPRGRLWQIVIGSRIAEAFCPFEGFSPREW